MNFSHVSNDLQFFPSWVADAYFIQHLNCLVFSFYQFEYMSQHLVFANCIPLILKYLNQNISAFVAAKNT